MPHYHCYIINQLVQMRRNQPPPRAHPLSQLNQECMGHLLPYLRLAEIVCLYQSAKCSHRHQEMKDAVFSYLVLAQRRYTKWEEKEFLDLLVGEMEAGTDQGRQNRRIVRKQWQYLPDIVGPVFGQPNRNGTQLEVPSQTNRFKQSIVDDVDRTCFKHSGYQFYHPASLGPPGRVGTHCTDSSSSSSLYCNENQSNSHSPYHNPYHNEPTLQSQMHEYMKTVLLNISNRYPQLGYIQGFNCIAKIMYLTGYSEPEAYRYLSYLIEWRHLGAVLLNGMAGITRLAYVLKVFIYNYLPKIYECLAQAELQPQIFATSWFTTLFSEDLSVWVVNKLWHLFVLEGWKVFIRFGIALLCAYEREILNKRVDDLFTYLRRLAEEFNEEIKAKCTRQAQNSRKSARNREYFTQNHPLSPSRQEVVWKLTTSIQVQGYIVSRLCRSMQTLHHDPEIELWRLDSGSINRRGVISSTRSSQKLSLLHTSGSLSAQCYGQCQPVDIAGTGAQLCCDSREGEIRARGAGERGSLFALCHNVGAYQ